MHLAYCVYVGKHMLCVVGCVDILYISDDLCPYVYTVHLKHCPLAHLVYMWSQTFTAYTPVACGAGPMSYSHQRCTCSIVCMCVAQVMVYICASMQC